MLSRPPSPVMLPPERYSLLSALYSLSVALVRFAAFVSAENCFSEGLNSYSAVEPAGNISLVFHGSPSIIMLDCSSRKQIVCYELTSSDEENRQWVQSRFDPLPCVAKILTHSKELQQQ